MQCSEYSERISLHVDRLLDDPQVELLCSHLEECTACRAEWEAIHNLSSLLASAPTLCPSSGFSGRVALRLRKRAVERQRLRCVAAMMAGWVGLWSLGSIMVGVPLVLRWRSLLTLAWLDVIRPVFGAAARMLAILTRTSRMLAGELVLGPTWPLLPVYVLLAVALVVGWARVVVWLRQDSVSVRSRILS